MHFTFKKRLAMLVNLPNGKTIDMSLDDYLRIGMEDYSFLMSYNLGTEMEDPFFGSVLRGIKSQKEDEEVQSGEEEEDDDESLEEGDLFAVE